MKKLIKTLETRLRLILGFFNDVFQLKKLYSVELGGNMITNG